MDSETVASSSSTLETTPLLIQSPIKAKKPFYRARPLWLVPFAVTASLVRGMTLAPRVEVFTQLSCLAIHHHTYNHTNEVIPIHESLPVHDTTPQDTHGPIILTTSSYPLTDDDTGEDDDPRRIPSPRCVSDPDVQSGAARTQTMVTTIMGIFSLLSTGFWGHFSERHGRTSVLALSTLGLFLTDLTFILVSTPGSPLASHGHKLLVLAPFIEGALGGWATLQSGCFAYVSDCTSSGSRANIFSRFMGVIYLGFSVGPSIGGWIIRNGIPGIDRIGTHTGQGKSVTEVFWLAICCSFINLLLVTFVFPESLSKEQRAAAAEQYRLSFSSKGKNRAIEGQDQGTSDNLNAEDSSSTKGGIIRELLSPLALMLPVVITESTGNGFRKRKDWSLTFLSIGLFLFMLSTGIYQMKYLYAVHTYHWEADTLSYYISYMGGVRAVTLLLLLPLVIKKFKPKVDSADKLANGKPKITKGHLAREIHFDLLLSRACVCLDILANFLVAIFPVPAETVHHMMAVAPQQLELSSHTSAVFFVAASTFSSLGAGIVPAVQSLALCITQARTLLDGSANATEGEATEEEQTKLDSGGSGKLFGALSTLQALGQMIIAPLLFGLVYSETVAHFPKAIFVTACGSLMLALCAIMLVRSPVERDRISKVNDKKSGSGKAKAKKHEERDRGRSRVSKDLFGGAFGPSDDPERAYLVQHRHGSDPVA